MCGKFTQMASWREVVAFSQPLTVDLTRDSTIVTTPMRMAHVIRLNERGAREFVPMRWGFADRTAKSPLERPKHMHVRSETIDARPTFREAFAQARGIVPVQTFNEGEDLPNGKAKQWVITPKDGKPIGIAVIWEEWIKGDERLLNFVQVTVPANPRIAKITDRMPAILEEKNWGAWLGETDASLDAVKALLVTYDDKGNWTMTEQNIGKKMSTPAEPELF